MTSQKNKTREKNITKRNKDFASWYTDVVEAADLAEHAPVRGCMTIKPYGYAIWENIQKILDQKIKKTGAKNAYFPLLIPESFLAKEAEHVEGFSPECAVVTHAGGKKLKEPLVVRPTSETIIYEAFSRWIHSYRDLPLMINQWANIVRWEMRPRLFLRTSEFLWQEGHTVHISEKEADKKAKEMLGLYESFLEKYLALPATAGLKSESEKFAGALRTYTVEAIVQDGKAIQAGTSHNLGQNFAKAFGIRFLDKNSKEQYGWQTSWGVSTRMIGSLIMMHSDDNGLVLPPQIAPVHLVIIPIWNHLEDNKIKNKAEEIKRKLDKVIKVEIDYRDMRPGPRFFEWEKKGVPLRMEIGTKEVADNSVVLVRRDTGKKESVSMDALSASVDNKLKEIQQNLLAKARKLQKVHKVDDWKEFRDKIEKQAGFVAAHWCGKEACEDKINKQTKATIRCLPLKQNKEKGECIVCKCKSNQRALFAKAY